MSDKIANWFKGIFNVCSTGGCCTSKNPIYGEDKYWKDINN